MSESQDRLKEELRNYDYRHAYAEDYSNTSIATQIRVLREQRGLTQEDLAKKIGTKQAGISRLENVNYSAWKTETLRKIARAFDVHLRITFETFGTLLEDAEKFSRKSLERPRFDNDPEFYGSVTVPVNIRTTIELANNPLISQPSIGRFVVGVNPNDTVWATNNTINPQQGYPKPLSNEDKSRKDVLIHSQFDGNLPLITTR